MSTEEPKPKALVLLSGGLDSSTLLAFAIQAGYLPYALTFRYGQRHELEIERAEAVAKKAGVLQHLLVDIDLRAIGGSALTSDAEAVPKGRTVEEMKSGIPNTYVPARNTIFLSFALSWAEVLGARDIFIGVNALDYAGYPDCRPEYLNAFQNVANLATEAGVSGGQKPLRIHAPLLMMSKTEIIKLGLLLGVDYSITNSCYDPTPEGACGECDACTLRLMGFAENHRLDPVPYRNLRHVVSGR